MTPTLSLQSWSLLWHERICLSGACRFSSRLFFLSGLSGATGVAKWRQLWHVTTVKWRQDPGKYRWSRWMKKRLCWEAKFDFWGCIMHKWVSCTLFLCPIFWAKRACFSLQLGELPLCIQFQGFSAEWRHSTYPLSLHTGFTYREHGPKSKCGSG